MPPTSAPQLLTPEQTAERLGVSVTTLATWRCTKRVALPFVKLGSAVRYSEAAVADFIAKHTVGAAA
jgi:excisionase family DNA binding protein